MIASGLRLGKTKAVGFDVLFFLVGVCSMVVVRRVVVFSVFWVSQLLLLLPGVSPSCLVVARHCLRLLLILLLLLLLLLLFLMMVVALVLLFLFWLIFFMLLLLLLFLLLLLPLLASLSCN